MRLASLFLSVLFGASLAAQEKIPISSPSVLDDRYSVSVVSTALHFLQRRGPSYGAEGKMYIWPLLPLGDHVSIAILKIYRADELVQPENAGAYLTAARNAFSQRNSVLERSDTDPKVTLFVLAYLKRKEVPNAVIEKRIAYLERCVTDFTCSSQGEYDFFHKSR